MALTVNGKTIETDDLGYLVNPEDWDEDVARALAEEEGIELTEEVWELIRFFRDYYEEHMGVHPTMHKLLLMREKRQGTDYETEKAYRDYLWKLFPKGPIQTLSKLAGLPSSGAVEETEE